MNPGRDYCTPHSDHELECLTQLQRDSKKASWWWDLKNDVTTWSEQLYRIAGRDPETVLPSFKEHSCFYTSDSWHRLTGATVRVLQTGQPFELELQMRRPDGTRRRVMGRGEAVRDAEGNILRLCGTVEDITERGLQVIRTEEPNNLVADEHKISGQIIQALDAQNREIAKELRDHISQRLCLLAVDIQGLAPVFPEGTQHAHLRIEELWREAAAIVDDIVRASNQLHPSNVDLLGLPLAIRGLCREFATQNGVSVECSCTDVVEENIGKDVALSLFRVLRDVLANVTRPHHGVKVSVELLGSSTELLLRVSQGGLGLQMEKAKVMSNPGFIRMKERLRSIGGELEIWSTPTGGTRIEGRAPLRKSLE